MTALSDRLVEANRTVWTAMAAHPFVVGLADGTLPDAALRAWVQQDRIFVLQERRVVGALHAHGPPGGLDGLLAGLDGGLVAEADAFARTAVARGFPAAAERAYLDTWTAVAARSPAGSPYREWIDNWTGEPFRAFVADLGRELDELAGSPSPAVAERLGSVFTGAVRFELAFWEMCWRGQAWPG